MRAPSDREDLADAGARVHATEQSFESDRLAKARQADPLDHAAGPSDEAREREEEHVDGVRQTVVRDHHRVRARGDRPEAQDDRPTRAQTLFDARRDDRADHEPGRAEGEGQAHQARRQPHLTDDVIGEWEQVPEPVRWIFFEAECFIRAWPPDGVGGHVLSDLFEDVDLEAARR